MSAAVHVRPATPEDADDSAALGALVSAQPLLGRYGVTAAGLSAELRRLSLQMPDGATQLLLAEDRGTGRLCGFARFSLRGTFGAGAYLQLIAIVPGIEGRGAGTALLHSVEAAVAPHSPALFLLASDFNVGAQRFYERHGYARAGALPDFARPGICEIIFWKRLRRDDPAPYLG